MYIFAISSIIKQEQLSLTNEKGSIVGLFDAFKGMIGGKTDAPVNIDNTNNVTAGVNPIIPSTRSPITSDTSNNSGTNDQGDEHNASNDPTNDTPNEVSTPQFMNNQPTPENEDTVAPSDDITSSNDVTDNTTSTENASFPATSVPLEDPAQNDSAPGSNDLSTESNSGPVAPTQALPDQADNTETVNEPGNDVSAVEAPDNSVPSASTSPDSTENNKEQNQDTVPQNTSEESTEKPAPQDDDTPKSV
jgi:hypothetical protein